MQHPKRSLSLLAQLIPLTCLLLLCGIPTATAADGCLLKRTPEVCPQGKQAQEIFCLRKENTLRAVMDCVSYSSVGVDHKLCSSRNDGIPGNGFEDFGQPFEGELTDITANCLAPRLVLVSASLVCLGSSLGGLLQSCPEGDPNFFSCLCNHHVQADSFAQLSKCFSPSNQNDLNCFSFAKRKEYVKRDDYEPPPGMVSNMKRSLLPVRTIMTKQSRFWKRRLMWHALCSFRVWTSILTILRGQFTRMVALAILFRIMIEPSEVAWPSEGASYRPYRLIAGA